MLHVAPYSKLANSPEAAQYDSHQEQDNQNPRDGEHDMSVENDHRRSSAQAEIFVSHLCNAQTNEKQFLMKTFRAVLVLPLNMKYNPLVLVVMCRVGWGGGGERQTLCGGSLCINLLFEYLRVVFFPPQKEENKKLLCQDLTRIRCVCTIIIQRNFVMHFP